MTPIQRRRVWNITILGVISVVLIVAERVLRASYHHSVLYSGWGLLLVLVTLAAYRLRKTVPFLPLGSSSAWLQLHIYGGLLSAVLFALHVGPKVPNGWYESLLALLYLTVFTSGVTGLVLTRRIPVRLTMRGEEVLFERIPIFVARLRADVEAIVAASDSSAISDVYVTHIRPFFQRPLNLFWHLAHSERPRHSMLSRVDETVPFVAPDAREALSAIADRIRVKDDLDYQYALQAALKYWLFLHVPLTWALMIFAMFHMVSAMAFSNW